jgi:hypothetical protein
VRSVARSGVPTFLLGPRLVVGAFPPWFSTFVMLSLTGSLLLRLALIGRLCVVVIILLLNSALFEKLRLLRQLITQLLGLAHICLY